MRKPDDRGQVLLICLFFFLLSVLFTYPLWTRPNSVLNEILDTGLNTWILAWDAHAILHKPLELFNASMFFPHERTLAYSENLLGSAILVAPLNWWGKPVLAYNVVLFTSFLLSGVTVTLWVRAISGSLCAALTAGFIWAFAPVKFDHLAHLQLLTGQWIPFTLLAIARYFETGARRYAVAAGSLFGLQYLCGIYLGLMFLPFAVIYAGLLFVHRRATGHIPAAARVLRDGVVAALIAAALVVPISLPYLQLNEGEGFQRNLSDIGGAQMKSYLSPSGINKAPHMLALHAKYRVTEGNFFPGVLPWLLFIGGLLGLLPKVLRQRWPGGTSDTGTGTGTGTRPPGPRWALWAALASSLLLGLLHVAGFVVAQWWTRPRAFDTVLILCQSVHPSMWLAFAAGLTVLLWLRSRPALPLPAAHYTILGFMLLISYLLAFGPTVSSWDVELGTGPYRILHEFARPYRSIRAVGRFGFLWVLFFAAMVGLSLAAGSQLLRARLAVGTWRRLRVAMVALLSATLLFEYQVWPLPTVEVSPSASRVDVWLAEQPQGTSVLHMPLAPGGHPAGAVRYLLGSTLHFLPLVNGYSGFSPPSWIALAAKEGFSDEFFSYLRGLFPVDYLIVHGNEYGDDFEADLAPRLLADRRHLRLVERLDDVLVFEVPRGRDAGIHVLRRFSRAQLRGAAAIAFQARVDATASGRTSSLQVGWGAAPPQRLELGTSWRGFELPLPAAGVLDPDGTATFSFSNRYSLDAVHPGNEIGSSGRQLRADILLDVQVNGVLVAINDVWLDGMSQFGIQAYNLGRLGDQILGSATFLADDLQDEEEELIAFLDSVPEGEVVALGIRYPVGFPVSPAVAAALSELGSSLQAGSSVRKYALIGARGLAPGSAAEQVGLNRAHVLVGESGHARPVSLRRIRLLHSDPPG